MLKIILLVIRLVIVPLLFSFFAHPSFSQATVHYTELPDSIVKRELSAFVKTAVWGMNVNKNSKVNLQEVKLSRCGADFVSFESGDWIALDKLVTITSSESDPGKVAEVRYLHYKFQIILADSAIAGIINPRFCINPKANYKIGKATRSDCRVFQSPDKKRVYIYMLNGTGPEQYEVTWVINENKYYGRIIDKVKATD